METTGHIPPAATVGAMIEMQGGGNREGGKVDMEGRKNGEKERGGKKDTLGQGSELYDAFLKCHGGRLILRSR